MVERRLKNLRLIIMQLPKFEEAVQQTMQVFKSAMRERDELLIDGKLSVYLGKLVQHFVNAKDYSLPKVQILNELPAADRELSDLYLLPSTLFS